MVKLEDENTTAEVQTHDDSTHDPYFLPIVTLPEVDVPNGEDNEEEIFRIRAKLFRFDGAAEPPEWKERGTGDVRLLRHTEKKGKVRLLMRRDKTLRICANHYIQAWFQLKAMRDSERAFIWLVQADYADEEAKTETLAIRFANAENAKKFKDAFDEAVVNVIEWEATRIADAESKLRSPLKKDKVDQDEAAKKGDTADDASEKLDSLTIK